VGRAPGRPPGPRANSYSRPTDKKYVVSKAQTNAFLNYPRSAIRREMFHKWSVQRNSKLRYVVKWNQELAREHRYYQSLSTLLKAAYMRSTFS
jgi:hypothetical protein